MNIHEEERHSSLLEYTCIFHYGRIHTPMYDLGWLLSLGWTAVYSRRFWWPYSKNELFHPLNNSSKIYSISIYESKDILIVTVHRGGDDSSVVALQCDQCIVILQIKYKNVGNISRDNSSWKAITTVPNRHTNSDHPNSTRCIEYDLWIALLFSQYSVLERSKQTNNCSHQQRRGTWTDCPTYSRQCHYLGRCLLNYLCLQYYKCRTIEIEFNARLRVNIQLSCHWRSYSSCRLSRKSLMYIQE